MSLFPVPGSIAVVSGHFSNHPNLGAHGPLLSHHPHVSCHYLKGTSVCNRVCPLKAASSLIIQVTLDQTYPGISARVLVTDNTSIGVSYR